MIINTLEEAEKIVNNFDDLYWDGWNIVSITNNDNAYSNKFGAYLNGRWVIKKTYFINRNGWSLPNMYGVVKNG